MHGIFIRKTPPGIAALSRPSSPIFFLNRMLAIMATTPRGNRVTYDTMGKLILQGSVRDLATRRWDAVVVGAGHNGLACAAYLARSGRQVLVLESRDRVGGACTVAEPWPGYQISPCAYLVGLLHPLVIEELDMAAYGFAWFPATAGLFVPFEDGSSIQLWDDDERCEHEVRRLSAVDVDGWRDFCAVKARLRDALRPAGTGDIWVGRAPTLDEIEEKLGGDTEARHMLFEWSMVECVENYFQDERPANGLPGTGRDRHQCQPPRPGHRVDPLPPPIRPAGRNSRHVGVRQRGDRHGLVHPLRHRT